MNAGRNYRWLREGEQIKEGDQFFNTADLAWCAEVPVGARWRAARFLPMRRRK